MEVGEAERPLSEIVIIASSASSTVMTVPAISYEPSSVMSSGWISIVSEYRSAPESTRRSMCARIPSLYSEAAMNTTSASCVYKG